MKLVVGLGNPGEEYKQTRHNVGFMVVDKMAEGKRWAKSKSGLYEYVWLKPGNEVLLIKPMTYMNKSGEAVKYVVGKDKELKSDDIWVVHDDLDIAWGQFKIQWSKGPRAHGGVESVEKLLKTDQFWRVRIGVDNRGEERVMSGREYILHRLGAEERKKIEEIVVSVREELYKRIDLY